MSALEKLTASIHRAIQNEEREKRRKLRGPMGKIRREAIDHACAILERDGHALCAEAIVTHDPKDARELDHGGRILLDAARTIRKELLLQ